MSRGRSGGGSNKTLWIVLGIGGALVLLCLCCVGVPGGIYLFNKDKFNSGIGGGLAAQDFLADAARGNVDGAYQKTSKNYQKRLSKDQFKAFLDRNPNLRARISDSLAADPNTLAANSVTMRGTVNTGSGSVHVTLKMVKEDNAWKVDDFTIP